MRQTPSDAFGNITAPYLLVIHIPVWVDLQQRRWVEPLWHKDLVRHLDYLSAFVLACPHVFAEPPLGYQCLEGYSIQYVALPRQRSRLRNLVSAPARAWAIWNAMREVEVVHCCTGDWVPYSLGNMTCVIAELQRKLRVLVVEGASWRVVPGGDESLLRRLDAAVSEVVNRECVSSADLVVFTQAEYKQSLMRHPERGHVINASWIDEADILSAEQAAEAWARKRAQPTVRLLFAGPLIPGKGTLDLIAAVRELRRGETKVAIDVIDNGDLVEECRKVAEENPDSNVAFRLVSFRDHGDELLATLREYHAVLVPSRSDEQPKIVYDAFSQAVAVLASSTAGLRDCIDADETGRFFEPGNPDQLAQAIQWAATQPTELERMGTNGIERAKTLTHREMHIKRSVLIRKLLAPARAPAAARAS